LPAFLPGGFGPIIDKAQISDGGLTASCAIRRTAPLIWINADHASMQDKSDRTTAMGQRQEVEPDASEGC
jgi:hypothetical protein